MILVSSSVIWPFETEILSVPAAMAACIDILFKTPESAVSITLD